MRKIFGALILSLAIVLILLSLSELKDVAETLRRSNLWFLLGAFALELLWLYNLAVSYRLLYQLVGLEERTSHLFLVVAAANFVNVVAPSAGLGGMAVFLDDARQRNHASGKVTVGGAVFLLLDYAAFICVLVLGMIALIRRNNLPPSAIGAALILLGIASVLAFLVYLGYRSADELGKALAWMARLVNRLVRPFLRRAYLSEQRAYEYAHEMAEGFAELRGKRREFILPFLYALNSKALLICILMVTFLAFSTPFSVGLLVGSFSIAYLFLIVSPTPSGVGFVEGTLTIALGSLGVPLGTATLIALTYRAVTFWFPLGLGAIAFRLLQSKPQKSSDEGG